MSPQHSAKGPAASPRSVREIDRRAIEELGLPGCVLMENAGAGAARCLMARGAEALERATRSAHVLVLCGAGNNAGDGYVVARYLANAGLSVKLWIAADVERLPADARLYERVAQNMGLERRDVTRGLDAGARDELARAPVIVDALLGTGARGPLRAPLDELVAAANAAPAWRAALDVPTGLDATSGRPAEPCFRADWTGTFVASKTGFETPGVERWLGVVDVIDIGIPPALVDAVRRDFAEP